MIDGTATTLLVPVAGTEADPGADANQGGISASRVVVA